MLRFPILLISVAFLFSCQRGSEQGVEFILSTSDLPGYETEIDHASMIEGLDQNSFNRGREIYGSVCINCHGDADLPGSIPTSFRFWEGNFKVGKDPYSIYQTLSRGYGQMPPQVHLVPQQKYDVINYIREHFIKEENPGQYYEVNQQYLSDLPKGDSIGPDAKKWEPWSEMDYGDFLIHTYELAGADAAPRERSQGKAPLPDEDFRYANFAYKGIAVRLDPGSGGVSSGKAWTIFDHDLMRLAGFWTGEGFIDWRSILMNGEHNISPRTTGELHLSNPVAPGWANPITGSWDDPREVARDGRAFGPLPRTWSQYKGLYHHDQTVVVSYTVGQSKVLESTGFELLGGVEVLTRTVQVELSPAILKMRVAPLGHVVSIQGTGGKLIQEGGHHVVEFENEGTALIKLYLANSSNLDILIKSLPGPTSLTELTQGGPSRFEPIRSVVSKGEDDGPFAVDILNPPYDNPWKSRMRLSGIDFFEGKDKAVVSCSEGDVWIVEGLNSGSGILTWNRIATGLFQPLGVKLIDGEIFVTCRDQIVVLKDLNGDLETDFYQSFNSDHQVTDHFHEFAMGLQVDESGNLYYAKSGRHAREALVPQHGTLLRVSPDGSETEIMASGFRAANGVCLNPDGTFIVTDQEGYWNPMNRINWVEPGKFYGNMWSFNPPKDSSDGGMEQPLCWVDKDLDRSPAELLWVDSEQWGPLKGGLINLSYGYGKTFMVLHEKVGDYRQGGLLQLPIPRLPTGIIRGRFHPVDGQLYVCGLSAWATNQMLQPGGLYRIRYTGKPLLIPLGLQATTSGLTLTFSDTLNPSTVVADNFEVKSWSLKRTRNYGSDRYDLSTLAITRAELVGPNKIRLLIPSIEPVWAMEVKYDLSNSAGLPITGFIQNTIHKLGQDLLDPNQKTSTVTPLP